MKIDVSKKQGELARNFEAKEWAIADQEHYGKAFDWHKKSKYYLRALENDEVVGILNLEIMHGVAEIKDILVAHSKHRKGIGKKLMLEAEKIAKQEGSHKMFLSTGGNWKARGLYESLGYVVTGGQKNHHLHENFVDYSKIIEL